MSKINTDSIPSYEFQEININKKKIIFHSFATESFFGWIPIYFHSIYNSYGFGTKFVFQTVNSLNLYNSSFQGFSEDVDIYNLEISKKYISDKLNININQLERFIKELKIGKLTEENYLLKIFFSVQLRYQSLSKIFLILQNKYDFDYLIHSDIDVYHRTNIIEKVIDKDFDIALFGREFKHLDIDKQPLGAYIILRKTPGALRFLNNFNLEINKLSFNKMPRNYGQISLKKVLLNNIQKAEFKFLDLTLENNLSFSKIGGISKSAKYADLWLNSNSLFKKFQKNNNQNDQFSAYQYSTQDLFVKVFQKTHDFFK